MPDRLWIIKIKYPSVEINKLQRVLSKAYPSTEMNQFSIQETSSYPGSRQHLAEFDEVISIALPLSRAMFADGLRAIKITKLTARAKNFVNDSHRRGL